MYNMRWCSGLYRNSRILSSSYGTYSRCLPIHPTAPTTSPAQWHYRKYSKNEFPKNAQASPKQPLKSFSKRRIQYLTASDALSLIACLQTKDFVAARRIVTDLHIINKPTITHEMDILLYQICVLLYTSGEMEQYDWFIEHLIFGVKYASEKALSAIMSIQLDTQHDLDKATVLFCRIAAEFKQTPWAHLQLTKLIQSNDETNIELCVDAIQTVRGPKMAQYGLAHAYTECGHIDKATDIYSQLPIVDDFKMIDGLLTAVQNQRKAQFLENFLKATEKCLPPKYRQRIFEKLLSVIGVDENIEQLERVCLMMIAEKLMPEDRTRNWIIKLFKANNVAIPGGWKSKYSWHLYQQNKLHAMLENDRLDEANAYYTNIQSQCDVMGEKLTRYLLAKNAEAGNVAFFQHFRELHQNDFTSSFKRSFKLPHFECKAYIAADRCAEYIDCLRATLENLGRWKSDDGEVKLDVPISLMDLMETPNAYEQLQTLALDCASNDYLRFICMIWCYNFINGVNVNDNNFIWSSVIANHQTIAATTITNILVQRRRIDKLAEFLNSGLLTKEKIEPFVLGRAYSRLFDGFYTMNKFDEILEHLEQAGQYISEEHLDKNTVLVMKYGTEDFHGRFRMKLLRLVLDYNRLR